MSDSPGIATRQKVEASLGRRRRREAVFRTAGVLATLVGVFAKRARGLMSRYIIGNQLSDSEGLKGFDAAGYRFNPKLSTENDWAFTRP